MKRDLDMLRTIMLKIETSNKAVHLTDLTDNRADRPTILFHVQLLNDAKFIDCRMLNVVNNNGDCIINRLTSAGCDYLDSVRNDSVWDKVKERLVSIGGSASLSVIKMIADGVIAANISGLITH